MFKPKRYIDKNQSLSINDYTCGKQHSFNYTVQNQFYPLFIPYFSIDIIYYMDILFEW